MLNPMRDKKWRHVPGGRRDDTNLWPRLVQKKTGPAESNASHELDWEVKVMIKTKKETDLLTHHMYTRFFLQTW